MTAYSHEFAKIINEINSCWSKVCAYLPVNMPDKLQQSRPTAAGASKHWVWFMRIDIDKMTESELVELNHRIVQRLKFLESMHHHNEMLKFNVGDKVSFEPPGRGRQIGILVKYNQKTVTIVTDSGQRWNVAPSLISKIKPVSTSGNVVIDFDGKKTPV